MLSHSNMMSVAHGALTLLDCFQEDQFLSFPLSHALERTAGLLPVHHDRIVRGLCAFGGQLGEDLVTIRPNI